MSKENVTIYGASDDLIELKSDGGIYDEWEYWDDDRVSVLVAGADGEQVEVTPSLTSVWNAQVRIIVDGKNLSVKWIKRPDAYGDPEDRAVVVTVTAPATVEKIVR